MFKKTLPIAFDSSAEGGPEQQSSRAGAAFSEGKVPARAGMPPASAAARLAPAPKSQASAFPEPRKVEAGVPSLSQRQRRELALISAAAVTVAAVGAGLMAYSAAALATGPIGWAAAALFLGGMAAYLAQRRLSGKNDFTPA